MDKNKRKPFFMAIDMRTGKSLLHTENGWNIPEFDKSPLNLYAALDRDSVIKCVNNLWKSGFGEHAYYFSECEPLDIAKASSIHNNYGGRWPIPWICFEISVDPNVFKKMSNLYFDDDEESKNIIITSEMEELVARHILSVKMLKAFHLINEIPVDEALTRQYDEITGNLHKQRNYDWVNESGGYLYWYTYMDLTTFGKFKKASWHAKFGYKKYWFSSYIPFRDAKVHSMGLYRFSTELYQACVKLTINPSLIEKPDDLKVHGIGENRVLRIQSEMESLIAPSVVSVEIEAAFYRGNQIYDTDVFYD
jgi:hypothetical protein